MCSLLFPALVSGSFTYIFLHFSDIAAIKFLHQETLGTENLRETQLEIVQPYSETLTSDETSTDASRVSSNIETSNEVIFYQLDPSNCIYQCSWTDFLPSSHPLETLTGNGSAEFDTRQQAIGQNQPNVLPIDLLSPSDYEMEASATTLIVHYSTRRKSLCYVPSLRRG